jgi:two-component system, chemotaxis family, chemotaxis protein CheY
VAKNILVVDDSASVRQVAGIALRGAGYEVIDAADGKQALTKLNGDKIHLIICDINMPQMDGIEFLKHVKAHPSYKFTPVIMLTTESRDDKKQEGRAAGAKAWIVKPFQPQTMLEAVAKLVMA